jgi:hypothetical protein
MHICQVCRIKAGQVRKDKGSHTAILATCSVCKQRKPILDSKHFKE